MLKKHLHVVAAVIVKNGKVFAAQRNEIGELALKWEFPGGKIEPGENPQQALIREIHEELSSTIMIDNFLLSVEHEYQTFTITLEAYLCSVIEGELQISEHLASCWLSRDELNLVDWAAADKPIVRKVATLLGGVGGKTRN